MLNLIIVGATGLVGKSFFIKYIEKSDMKYNLFFVASLKSKGKILNFKNNLYNLKILDEISTELDSSNTIFINCSSKQVVIEIVKKFPNSYVIDNSSQFRMNKNYPLIVPHINMSSFFSESKNYSQSKL